MQGLARTPVPIPAVPVTRLRSFVYATTDIRRLVAWEDEIALESPNPFIK